MPRFTIASFGFSLRSAIAFIACYCTIATNVFAQDTTQVRKDSLRVLSAKTIEIEGESDGGFKRDAFGESVTTAKLHEYSAEPIIAEALSLLGGGIDVKRYSTLGGVAFTSIHGLPAEYTVVYRDGIRVTNEQNSLTDLGRTSSYGIASIDFLSPAASMLLGGDAIGASINLLSRHASSSPQFELGGSSVAYDVTRDPAEQDYYGKADFTIADRAGISLTASNQHSDGEFPFLQPLTNAIVYRENNVAEVRDYSGTIDYALGDTATQGISTPHLTGLFDYTAADRGDPGAATIDYRGASEFLARQYDEDLFSALKYETAWDTTASFMSSLSYQTQYETYSDPQASIDDHYLNRILGAQFSGAFRISDELEGFVGGDLSRSYLYSNENYITSGDSLISRDRAGAYAALQTVAITNTEIIASLRTEATTNLQPEFLPQFSAVWHFQPSFQLGGSWSASYHAPTLNELYWKVGGNRNLKEEIGKNITGFLRYDLSNVRDIRGSFTATYFRADLINEIVWQPGQKSFFTPTNILTAVNQGIEFQAEMQWKWSQQLAIELSEDYTFLSALDKTPIAEFFDKEIPYSTPTSSIFRGEIQDALLGSIALVAQYRGHRYTDFGNTESGKLPPETTMDIVLSAKPIVLMNDTWIVLQLACRNITNLQYAEEPNFPLPGRNVRLNVSLRFHPL